ncbi:hypothetical protein V8B97DRAFT_676786 [Scleroderma yunnanense]
MQVPNPELTSRHGTMAEHSGPLSIRQNKAFVYDHGSPSGSEIDDAGNLVYSDPNKMDTDLDDDPSASLTSQSLNPDGTPKRPMNAFMIFARRRRPQVSSENQSMRTGEISKILSREWNAMDPLEKQFYLDQAKQLKDTFNQRYPDYVYKRRPNNSRRRRKADASIGSTSELQSTADSIDECSLEYPDTSPVDAADVDESIYTSHDTRHSSVSAETASSYAISQPRETTYPPGEPSTYGLQRGISYLPSHHGRPPPDVSTGLSVQSSAPGLDSGPSFYQSFPPSQVQSSYFPGSGGGGEGWSAGDDSTRIQAQSWSQSNQDHVHARERRGYEQQMPSHGWTSANQLDPSAAPGPRPPNYNFPTLTSPFYPTQGSSQESYSTLAHAPPTIPNPPYSSTMQSISLQGRANPSYDVGSYSSRPAVQPLAGSSTARNPYQHVRDAPSPSQPLTNYSHMQHSPPPGSGVDAQRRY